MNTQAEVIKKAITQKRRKKEAEKHCTGDFTKGMAEAFRVSIEILSAQINKITKDQNQ